MVGKQLPFFFCNPADSRLRTTAEFLTSLCDPNVRQFQPGREASTPKTPQELEAAFRASDTYKGILEDIRGYEQTIRDTDCADTRRFERYVDQCG